MSISVYPFFNRLVIMQLFFNAVARDLADWLEAGNVPAYQLFRALSKVRICASFFLFLSEVTSSTSRGLKLDSPPSIPLRRAIIISPHQRHDSASSHTAARWSARPISCGWIRSPQIRLYLNLNPNPIDHLYVDEFSEVSLQRQRHVK